MKIDPLVKKELKLRLSEALEQKKRQVTLTSAYQLNKSDQAELIKKVPQLKDTGITYLVDKSIIAGYVIKVGSKIIDLSLLGQLQSFQNIIYEID